MSIIETELDEIKPPLSLAPLAIRVRLAGPRDCEALCDLLDNPAHAREQVLAWLESPGTTLLVAQSELGILGVAVLLTRIVPMPGATTHKVVEVDNLVVRADLRGRRVGRRLLAAGTHPARGRPPPRRGHRPARGHHHHPAGPHPPVARLRHPA